MSEVFAHLFLAMTNSRLGLVEPARASLVEADRLAENIKPQCWVDELQLKLLSDETRAILNGSRETYGKPAAAVDD
jgi:hypothetical protein